MRIADRMDPDARDAVLVTGGAGFIGSHVVDALLAAGLRPRIYDTRPSPWHGADEVEQVRGDLADLDRLEDALDGCTAVVHLAAAADVNEVRDLPVDAEQRNARGTVHVLEAARRRGVTRVVYASTIWVYSDTPAERHDETLPLHAPAHLYTATKLAGEHYCHAYGELYGLEPTILRFGIPYGPRCRPAAVVPAFVAKARAGEPLTIAGDGAQSRRFVYVEDLAEGVVRALAPGAANRTYNLVGEEDVSVRQIAEAVCATVADVGIEHTEGRSGDFAGAPVCGERAARELGWRARTSFAEGLGRYVDWEAAQAAARAPEREPRIRVGPLLGRAALALGAAALLAALVLGVVTLLPVDQDLSQYGLFETLLVIAAPLVLAGAFHWDEIHARGLRIALTALAGACVLAAALPWPPMLHRLGHGHVVVLGLVALAAGLAACLPGRGAPLRAWLAAADD
jgi:UDP-glucose 4-epimerase